MFSDLTFQNFILVAKMPKIEQTEFGFQFKKIEIFRKYCESADRKISQIK